MDALPYSYPMRYLLILIVLLGLASLPTQAAPSPDASPIETTEDLLEAIRARYADTWYRTLTFVQATTIHTPQGPVEQTWYEAGAFPGRLRIDVAPLGSAARFLVRDTTTTIAQGSQVVRQDPRGNPLLLLGFDLPFLTVDEGLEGMQRFGIDTDAIREATWEGRPAVVVGREGEAQAWFDAERLVFVRLLEPTPQGVQDVRFEDYEPLAGGWIAPTVRVYHEDELVMEERYRAIQASVDLPEGTFDPDTWLDVAWWEAVGYDGTE